jgi:hypothetical protein
MCRSPWASRSTISAEGGNAAEPDIVIRPIPWGLGDGEDLLSGFIVRFAPGP